MKPILSWYKHKNHLISPFMEIYIKEYENKTWSFGIKWQVPGEGHCFTTSYNKNQINKTCGFKNFYIARKKAIEYIERDINNISERDSEFKKQLLTIIENWKEPIQLSLFI